MSIPTFIGTCSLCGGDVVEAARSSAFEAAGVYRIFKPACSCTKCGAVPKPPVIEMHRPRHHLHRPIRVPQNDEDNLS